MIPVEQRELDPEHKQVEPLGLLVVIAQGRGQPGQVLGDLRCSLPRQVLPRFPVGVCLDPATLRAYDERVHRHVG